MTRAAADHVPLAPAPPADDATLLARIGAVEARMRTRRTVRDFDTRPVPRAVIVAAIRIAGGAPNGANLQPWHFVAIGDPATKARIREGAEEEERTFYAGRAGEDWLDALAPLGTDASKPFLAEAPWLIVVFGERRTKDPSGKLVKPYYVPESVNIAIGFLIAALHEAGLATLTHTPAPMGFLNAICGRPTGDKPYVLLVVGHPKPDAMVPRRAFWKKPLDEIATFM